jgi:TRAP-type uncharacterized transport system substrate-binding protein
MPGSSSRDRNVLLAIVGVALLLMAGLIALFWQPAPPKVVVMSTGAEDGAYHAFARQYRAILARSGIDLVLKPSSGAVENLERLRTRSGGATVALIQGGIFKPGDAPNIESLGGMFFEPLWVFHRLPGTLQQLTELGGKRVAVGAPGSGTRVLVQELLALNRRPGADVIPVEIGGLAAAQALLDGNVDVAMLVSAPDGAAVRRLLNAPDVKLFNFRRADAYTRHLPYLTKLEVPEGAFDLAHNIPSADTALIATTASLVVSNQLHPVIADLLLGAASEIHGRGSALWHAGSFPSANVHELPLSADADVYYKNGPSMLQRYVPFWAVVWLQRLLYFGVPVIAVGLPLLRFMPALYRWSVRRRVYRWYGELSYIERAIKQGESDAEAHRRRLDAIETRINSLRVPSPFASEAYALKMHLQLVRGLLDAPLAAAPPGAARGL